MILVELSHAHTSQIVSLLLEGLSLGEGGEFAKLTPDAEQAHKLLSHALFNGVAWGAALMDGPAMRGFMLCATGQHWLFKESIAEEQILYIHPNYRRGREAARMIKHCLNMAKSKGLHSFHAGTSVEYNTDGVEKLYHLCGFRTIGKKFNLVF